MTKPFQITDEMQKEMVDGLTALASDPLTHDPAGQMFGAPRLRRRSIHRLSSEGDVPGPQDNSEMPQEEAVSAAPVEEDPINPSHYRRHPSGIECIEIVEHMSFNVGTAVKHLWKPDGDLIENLRTAQWYLDREIMRLQRVR